MEVDTDTRNTDEESDEENDTKKLITGTSKMKIEDYDVDSWEHLLKSFGEHYRHLTCTKFSRQMSNTSSSKGSPLCVFSDIFCDETSILTGLTDGTCKVINVNQLSSDEVILLDKKHDFKHNGLSDICCSRNSPSLFYTSSTTNCSIRQWDTRENSKKCCQEFTPDSKEGDKSGSRKKPILKFDLSCNDQLLCGGTELVEEDSYLLFWDVRSSKLLGAYWESHSDDITAVKFHHNQIHSLASGSTDGLLNTFNLLESEEDDALLFSFNTNSSVDSISWNHENTSRITCLTHTNEVQVWDSATGDRVKEIKREALAKAMMRSNPEAVHISSCHNLTETSHIGLMTCSLSGGNTRLIELNNDLEPTPYGLFIDQKAVIQTSQNLSKWQKWVTFDEHGIVKVWKATSATSPETKSKKSKKSSEERRNNKRYKPYSRD